MANSLSPDSLDSSFDDYDPGATVIGQETRKDGVISAVVAHRIPAKRFEGLTGGQARLRITPQDTPLILKVNAEVDEMMADPVWQMANPDVTRTKLVHSQLVSALTAKYGYLPTDENKDINLPSANGRAELILDNVKKGGPAVDDWNPLDMPITEAIPQEPRPRPQVQLPPPIPQYPQTRRQLPPPAAEPLWVAQQGSPGFSVTPQSMLSAAALGSLGIEGLDVTPMKPKYALLVDQQCRQHKLLWHWAQRVDEEACLLIFDSRNKPITAERLRKLITVQASTLFLGETKETVTQSLSMNLIPSVQAFRFGCFVFYYFLLAE